MFDQRTGGNYEVRYKVNYTILFTFFSATVEVDFEFKGDFFPRVAFPRLILNSQVLGLQIANDNCRQNLLQREARYGEQSCTKAQIQIKVTEGHPPKYFG